jgi:hypothetical protein
MSKLNWKNYSRYARDLEKEVWCALGKHSVHIADAWITFYPVERVWCTECKAGSETRVEKKKLVSQAKQAMKDNQQSLFNEEGK